MKRYISTLALCALAFIGLGSCNKVQEADVVESDARTVTFQSQMGSDTRTGLALKFVPDWRETDLDNVHLFETHNNNVVEGKEKKMTIAPDSNNEVAYFTADFQDSWVIIVDPNEAPATRASSSDYVYTSIVAQRDGDGKYFVPAVQYPETATLIDPNADFLVASGVETYQKGQSNKQIDLRFIRPVSISRLAIMNIPDTKVKEVVIYSENALTASATYDAVNFETSQVAFDEANGSKILTISYGSEGVQVPNEGIFNAYFVSLAGTKMITKVEVTTDVKTYTKEVNKSLVFKTPDFKSIAVNMDGASGGATTQPQTLSFVRGGKTFSVSSPDSYDLSNGAANYVAPTLTGVQGSPAPSVTWTISCNPANCASVSQNGAVTLNTTGTATITATVAAVENFRETAASYKLVITETSTPQQTVSLTKGGKTITEDTFDLGSGEYKMPVVETNALEYTVTWSVSNANATVENNKVVPQTAGDVVVTATVVAPGYQDKEISYTLHITGSAPDPSAPTYTRISFATGITTGKYLILNPAETHVFTTATGNTNAAALTPASGVISGDYASYEVTITKSGSNYTIQNGSGQYLYYDYNQGNTRVAYQSAATSWTANSVSADAYAFRFNWTENTNQNIYWNSTYFRLGGTGTDGVHLYRLDDGSTPEPPAETTYTLITETSELVSGATYLIVSADSGNYNGKDHGTVFAGDQAGTAVAISASSGVITGDHSEYEFVISVSGENYTLYGPNGYVTGNSSTSYSRYIQVSSSSKTMLMGRANDVKKDNTEGLVADAFYFYYNKTSGGSTSKEVLYLNSDGKYKIGGSGRKYGVYLYKKN